MKTRLTFALLLCSVLLVSMPYSGYTQRSDQRIFTTKGGKILTMEGKSPAYVDAIVVNGGKIIFTGTNNAALQYRTVTTKVYEIPRGETLMPGFIDAHAHAVQYTGTYDAVDLNPLPYGHTNTIDTLLQQLKDSLRKCPDTGTIIMGNGYDDSRLRERRHPTVQELNQVSADRPIFIEHVSGHMGVANSKLLHLLGFDNPDTTVAGGTIVRDANGNPTGLLIENANVGAMIYIAQHLMPKESEQEALEKSLRKLQRAEKEWFAYGITTLCEGRASPAAIQLVQTANKLGRLRGDFIVLPDFDTNKDLLKQWKTYYKQYDKHFKIGAVKFTLDGSPQGRSAWLKDPYVNAPLGEKPGFKGHPIYDHMQLYHYLRYVTDTLNMQVHMHCNGDAAIDEGLRLIDTLKPYITKDMINVMIHGQVCREDQVPHIKRTGIMPSWFPTHCYIWGLWHRDTVLGAARANHISPLRQGLDNNILFTIHTDAPVTPPDLLTAVWSAVHRRTLMDSTVVLGSDQVISAYEALKAITINAAIQWDEQQSKGSIKLHKRADLVLLKGDPLHDDQRYIGVKGVFKDGVLVYDNE
ncbi:amidohydrolase [Chitinophaga sp. Mgbs1]|uniref:Amidohydrolase n=1 Tax=Chitinophaga solisilvae TaxID=1233460 RepID=A0A433W959_9BACT|nr:amidohydrolase [Chitinophaga solisilvae]